MANDVVTFTQLYQMYSKDVYRFAYSLCRNADDAQEITSETFVKVWTASTDVRIETVKSFLMTIARSVYFHQRRRQKMFTPLEKEHADLALCSETQLEARSELDMIMKAIGSFSEIDREVMYLRTEEDLSYDEIACVTGLTVSAVKVKMFRMRSRLLLLRTQQEE